MGEDQRPKPDDAGGPDGPPGGGVELDGDELAAKLLDAGIPPHLHLYQTRRFVARVVLIARDGDGRIEIRPKPPAADDLKSPRQLLAEKWERFGLLPWQTDRLWAEHVAREQARREAAKKK